MADTIQRNPRNICAAGHSWGPPQVVNEREQGEREREAEVWVSRVFQYCVDCGARERHVVRAPLRVPDVAILRDPTIPSLGSNQPPDDGSRPPMESDAREYLKFIQAARWQFYEHFNVDPTHLFIPFAMRRALVQAAYEQNHHAPAPGDVNIRGLQLDHMEVRGQPDNLPVRIVSERGPTTYEWTTTGGFAEIVRVQHAKNIRGDEVENALRLIELRHRTRAARGPLPPREDTGWVRKPRIRDE